MSIDYLAFDIETGPLTEPQLRELYREPTLEEFVAGCPSNWKRETCEAKYPDAKAAGWQKFIDRAALDATTGRVVAIGVVLPGEQPSIIGHDSEAEMLDEFWANVADAIRWQMPLIGVNIEHFDLPFLIRRSWINRVPVPAGLKQGRYWSPIVTDLMVVWMQGGRDYVSLDTLCKAFGLPGKVREVDGVAVDGASFHRLWAENRPVAEKYLLGDLAPLAELARRMGVI